MKGGEILLQFKRKNTVMG